MHLGLTGHLAMLWLGFGFKHACFNLLGFGGIVCHVKRRATSSINRHRFVQCNVIEADR